MILTGIIQIFQIDVAAKVGNVLNNLGGAKGWSKYKLQITQQGGFSRKFALY